ncbi:MAG: 3-deoxy-manno-octulosonate cytidylyltransferase, partial [bacterium]|nr:3-deoxy-manno-octulosonate cytidylyltransferase [bacterium]
MAGTVVIVPARMGSTRLPGKPLADVCGRPLILRVLDGASKASLDRLVVATDSDQVRDVVTSAGYEAVLTGEANCGTERVFMAWQTLGFPGDRIVNLQGDEPFVEPGWIEALTAGNPSKQSNSVVTLAKEVSVLSANESSVVKVVMNSSGEALYFSRSSIPWGSPTLLQHIGVYCFTPESLRSCINSPPGILSDFENLEQLKWMENGVKIKVIPGKWNAMGVDTPDD